VFDVQEAVSGWVDAAVNRGKGKAVEPSRPHKVMMEMVQMSEIELW
jgi:hypothetical protein